MFLFPARSSCSRPERMPPVRTLDVGPPARNGYRAERRVEGGEKTTDPATSFSSGTPGNSSALRRPLRQGDVSGRLDELGELLVGDLRRDPSRSRQRRPGGSGVNLWSPSCRPRRSCPADPARPWKTRRRESRPSPLARAKTAGSCSRLSEGTSVGTPWRAARIPAQVSRASAPSSSPGRRQPRRRSTARHC